MTALDSIVEHHQLCDELHQLALEENRALRRDQRPGDPALLERKRQMLEKLDSSLGALRAIPAASAREPRLREQLEKTRARILQIIQLDQENEQLLLRYSLASSRPGTAQAPKASSSMLQRIYARCA